MKILENSLHSRFHSICQNLCNKKNLTFESCLHRLSGVSISTFSPKSNFLISLHKLRDDIKLQKHSLPPTKHETHSIYMKIQNQHQETIFTQNSFPSSRCAMCLWGDEKRSIMYVSSVWRNSREGWKIYNTCESAVCMVAEYDTALWGSNGWCGACSNIFLGRSLWYDMTLLVLLLNTRYLTLLEINLRTVDCEDVCWICWCHQFQIESMMRLLKCKLFINHQMAKWMRR